MLLLIDNYDSFTYNLVHYFNELGKQVEVVRNDATTPEAILERKRKKEIDGVIISPGPCDPAQAGICLDVIRKSDGELPIFGVCLGHQSIGEAYGGKVIRAPQPMHGKTSQMFHSNKTLFSNLPSPFLATRYHSLIVEKDSLPKSLEVTAETSDGIIMGLSHKQHNVHGVQFHPESIASQHGHAILKNFLDML